MQLLDIWGEASVDAEHFVVDDGSDGEEIEDLSESSPDVEGSVLFDALVVEAVDLGNEPGLMVASEEGDSVSVPHLERQEQKEGFNAVSASINIVPQKDVVCVGRVPTDLEEFQQIVELSVDVPADGDGGSNFDNIGLIPEDLLGGFAQFLDCDFLYLFLPLDLLYDVLDCFPGGHGLNYQILSN